MTFFATIAIIYLTSIVTAYFYSQGRIFPKQSSSYTNLPHLHFLEHSDANKIATVHLKTSDSRSLLIYHHGNGEDLGQILPILELYQKKGISVLAYDYPGYGMSSGHPTESALYESANRVYTYATNDLSYQANQITLYGRSLGSGPACWLAEKYPVHGLILEGAFTSTFRVMTQIKLLPFDYFDNLKKLKNIDCPVLLIHGKEDRTIPFSHALKNRAVLGPKADTYWLPDAGHNDIIASDPKRYWETVLPFIQSSDISKGS